jgi:uncharacterized membrane protein
VSGPNDFDEERRRIVRRISLLTWGLIAAAVLLAIVGGALLAWIFTGIGWPFLRSWPIISALLLGIPALIHLVYRPSDRDDHGSEE